MTRRRFLGQAASLIFGGGLLAACGGGTKPGLTGGITVQLKTYRLSTTDAACSTSACSCRACEKHAANKLFASRDAADKTRAHTHCNCTVIEGILDGDRWQKLFGSPGKPERTAVDRRDPAVAQILA
jgi:hypothetical protein